MSDNKLYTEEELKAEIEKIYDIGYRDGYKDGYNAGHRDAYKQQNLEFVKKDKKEECTN